MSCVGFWDHIMMGRAQIIPIYFDVEPEDFRHIRKWYALAFEEHN